MPECAVRVERARVDRWSVGLVGFFAQKTPMPARKNCTMTPAKKIQMSPRYAFPAPLPHSVLLAPRLNCRRTVTRSAAVLNRRPKRLPDRAYNPPRWPCASASSPRSPGRSRTTSTSTSPARRRSCAGSGTASPSWRRRRGRPTCAPAGGRCCTGRTAEVIARRPGAAASRAAAGSASRSACARTSGSRSRAAATTSSTASSPGCRASRTSRCTFSHALSVATFFSVERLNYPHGRGRRDRLLARVDALLATSPEVAEAAAIRFPGDYRARHSRRRPGALPAGGEAEADRARVAPDRAAAGALGAAGAPRAARLGAGAAADEAAHRPADGAPRRCANASTCGRRASGAGRAALLAEAAIYVPAIDGLARARLEAAAAGAALVEPPGLRDQPELAGAAVARLAEQEDVRARKAAEARAWAAPQSFEALGARAGRGLPRARRAPPAPAPAQGAARGPRLDPRRPAPPHVVVARLRDRGRRSRRARASPRSWARSRSPTTTSSAARSRPSSWHVGATSSSSPARRSRPTARAR